MRKEVSRRQFLNTSLAALAGSVILSDCAFADATKTVWQVPATLPATTIRAMKRTLDINGKAADVLGLLQPDGTQGMSAVAGSPFRVTLNNELTVPTAIHWHGLHPPNNEDGVPGVTQLSMRPNASALYNFPVLPAGTHWMHSHQGLQEAQLLAAPLIVRDPADRERDEQEIVLFLSDYSFTHPPEVYAKLKQGSKMSAGMGGMSGMKDKPDANDVNYDAYLANDRTLADPEVVKVEKNSRVRLRIINGSSGTNFFIDLGSLSGELIATDGMPVKPVQVTRLPLAIAQRADVLVRLPREGGAFPILALREFSMEQTGIILATPGASVSRLPEKGSTATGLLTLEVESQLAAINPLKPRQAEQTILRLQGNMSRYDWLINDVAFDVNDPQKEAAQVHVKYGQRAGHSFQVVAINDRQFSGALRDTVLVPGKTSVTVEFDADNPGLWYVHCHVLWHLAAGMATLVQYEA